VIDDKQDHRCRLLNDLTALLVDSPPASVASRAAAAPLEESATSPAASYPKQIQRISIQHVILNAVARRSDQPPGGNS
jgi:hypothetical protein